MEPTKVDTLTIRPKSELKVPTLSPCKSTQIELNLESMSSAIWDSEAADQVLVLE
jgi:hypothetical protein